MGIFFRGVLGVHVAAGILALLVFWVPVVTKKGGRAHRRFGWVYVAAAAGTTWIASVHSQLLRHHRR